MYQYYNALLYHLLQGCVDISGTHYRIDSDFISQHFMAGDLRDGKGYYDWAMSFKTQADPTAQGELIRKVYAKGLISVSITGEALIRHITDMAADWAAITSNSKEAPAGYYDALLATLPVSPETSKVVIFRTVSASILYSFDIVLAVFTVPAGTPMTPAAANERLAGAPGGAASHRCVEAVVFFRGQHAQRCDSPLDRAVWWVQQSSRSCRVRR